MDKQQKQTKSNAILTLESARHAYYDWFFLFIDWLNSAVFNLKRNSPRTDDHWEMKH